MIFLSWRSEGETKCHIIRNVDCGSLVKKGLFNCAFRIFAEFKYLLLCLKVFLKSTRSMVWV